MASKEATLPANEHIFGAPELETGAHWQQSNELMSSHCEKMKPSTNLAAGPPPEHRSPTGLRPPAAGPLGMEMPSSLCRMTSYGAATKHLLLQLLQCQVGGSTETGCNWVSGGVHFGKMHQLYHIHLCVCGLGRLSTEQTPQCSRNVKREREREREEHAYENLKSRLKTPHTGRLSPFKLFIKRRLQGNLVTAQSGHCWQ